MHLVCILPPTAPLVQTSQTSRIVSTRRTRLTSVSGKAQRQRSQLQPLGYNVTTHHSPLTTHYSLLARVGVKGSSSWPFSILPHGPGRRLAFLPLRLLFLLRPGSKSMQTHVVYSIQIPRESTAVLPILGRQYGHDLDSYPRLCSRTKEPEAQYQYLWRRCLRKLFVVNSTVMNP